MNYADIKLGYACNNNCIHCVIIDQKKKSNEIRGSDNRSTYESKMEIKKSLESGYRKIVLTGGEPTIRKDIEELVIYADELKLEISMQTNGRMFCDINFARRIVPHIKNFIIAIHGSKSEIHDKITMVNGSFNQTIEGIKNIISLGGNISAKMVLSTINYKDILNTVQLMEKANIIRMNVAFPHACEELLHKYNEIVPYYSEIYESIENTLEYVKESKFNVDFETILPCTLSKKYDIKYFSDFKLFNVSTELKQLDKEVMDWNIIRKSIKRKMIKCKECIYNSVCEGFWMEYILIRGEEEFIPVKKEYMRGI